MDCKTGTIHHLTEDELRDMQRMRQAEQGKPLLELTEEQARELEPLGAFQRKNHMRNKPCVCGSGRKFKRCCWSSYA
tara:strand:- start:335 stop:565 length:231 start_codon:yes stop_codon:yes gene_type:complete